MLICPNFTRPMSMARVGFTGLVSGGARINGDKSPASCMVHVARPRLTDADHRLNENGHPN